jgi:hypothetical protein
MRARLGLGLAVMAVLVWGAWGLLAGASVTQPIEFPHKTHLELKDPKLECTTCHDRAAKSAAAGRPSTKKCLSCHSGAEAKSAEEKKLQAFGENGREIPWQRVWRLPSHVFFSHRTHVALATVRCQTCHGPMETLTRPPARPLKVLAMNDCIGCHERWRWPPDPDQQEQATGRVEQTSTARRVSTDCNACHR